MGLQRTGFGADMWEAIGPTFDQVVGHPFVKELQDGTLSREVFARFIVQDSLYLREYGPCLAMCAARVEARADSMFFAASSKQVVETEDALHGGLMAELGIDERSLASALPSPTTVAYTNWERRACWSGTLHEAVGSVLPCYWFYADLGAYLAERGGSRDPSYQAWIDNYAAEAFTSASQAALDICTRIGDRLPESKRASMIDAVVMSARYEWMFWDSAYQGEVWAI